MLHGPLQCYERRGKEVIGSREAKRWSEVTPSMMSDEEEQGDTYIRHLPLYRSTLLSQFIDKLDGRHEKRNSGANHPRKQRVLGCSVDVPIPSDAKKWMIKPDLMRNEVSTSLEIQGEHDMNQDSPMSENQVESDLNQASPHLKGHDTDQATPGTLVQGEEDMYYSDRDTDDEQESDELF